MMRGEAVGALLIASGLGVLAYGQAAVQAISDQRGFFAGLAASATIILGLLGLLYRAFVGWAKQVQADVHGFGERLTTFQEVHARTHAVQDSDATRRHEAVLAAVQKHADVTAATVGAVQLDLADVKARTGALERFGGAGEG